MVCDGILVSTPIGSTAYNLSARGPIIPLNANILALTPISSFRPRRWRGALLPQRVKIRIEVLNFDTRPVSATADNVEARDIKYIEISTDKTKKLTILHDSDHSLDERIMKGAVFNINFFNKIINCFPKYNFDLFFFMNYIMSA